MIGQRECPCAVKHIHFVPSSSTLLKVLLIVLWLSSTCAGTKAFLPSTVCQNISGIEVRFYDYFPGYLGSYPAPVQGEEYKYNESGQGGEYKYNEVAEILTDSARMCCGNLNVSFVWLKNTNSVSVQIQYLVKADTLTTDNDSGKFIFYFPEFSEKGMRQVYEYTLRRPFLPVLKSPGHAVVMRTSEAKKGVEPIKTLAPSLPLIVLLFTMATFFGIAVWFLDHWKNGEEFPSPFIVGVFEGLWWAVVTMTTVGYGDKAPRSIFARLLTIIWMFTSFTLFTLIASNSTSIIATQQVSKIHRTLGLKIGTLNSKSFVESEMNLGAEIIGYNHSQYMIDALLNGDIDRFLFPSYVDFLLMRSRYKDVMPALYAAKVLDQAFQVGLVLSQPSDLDNEHHAAFYSCLRGTYGFWGRKSSYGYSSIEQTDDISLNLLDTSQMWHLCRYILYCVCAFVVGGMAWDVWKYFKSKLKGSQRTQPIELQ